MTANMKLEEAGKDLASVLTERRAGSLEVLDVLITVVEDRDGIPAVNLTAVLSDPLPGDDTWPLESLLPLRRDVRARANEMGLEAPVYLWFKPTTDPPQDDES